MLVLVLLLLLLLLLFLALLLSLVVLALLVVLLLLARGAMGTTREPNELLIGIPRTQENSDTMQPMRARQASASV
jgi:hypothetical protein